MKIRQAHLIPVVQKGEDVPSLASADRLGRTRQPKHGRREEPHRPHQRHVLANAARERVFVGQRECMLQHNSEALNGRCRDARLFCVCVCVCGVAIIRVGGWARAHKQ